MAKKTIEQEAIALADEVERFMRRYFGRDWVAELSEHEFADGRPCIGAANTLANRIAAVRKKTEAA